jgi:hypothetical protein
MNKKKRLQEFLGMLEKNPEEVIDGVVARYHPKEERQMPRKAAREIKRKINKKPKVKKYGSKI